MSEDTEMRIRVRRQLAAEMICPDCRSQLKFVPAREMHPAHAAHELARKCTAEGCAFICFQGDEA